MQQVGCGGVIKYYDDCWQCWICYKYRATVSSDWAWEWAVFTRSFSVLVKNFLSGICVIIRGIPQIIPMNNAWRAKIFTAPREYFEFDTKYENLGPNPNYTRFALTNGDIARYWDEMREPLVTAKRLRDFNRGMQHKWDDDEYVTTVRSNIAKKLKIPTLWPTADVVWGYNFETFHCTCGVVRNLIKQNAYLTYLDYDWTIEEINEFVQVYGSQATTQQHEDWMKFNTNREKDVLFTYSSNGHGYKKIIHTMASTIVKGGAIAYGKLLKLFEQYQLQNKQNVFFTAKMYIEFGEIQDFENGNESSDSSMNHNDSNHSTAGENVSDDSVHDDFGLSVGDEHDSQYPTDSDIENNNNNNNTSDSNSDDNNNNNNNNNNNSDTNSDDINNHNNNNDNSDTNSDDNNNNNNNIDPNQLVEGEIVQLYAVIAKFSIRYVYYKYLQEILYYMWKSKFNKPPNSAVPPEIVRMQTLAKKAGWIALQGDSSLVCLKMS